MVEIDEEKEEKEISEERDEELDIAKAVEKAQDIMRKIVGNLLTNQFKLESIKQNGTETRYIIICSVVPDIGKERDYYFIKIDIETGKLVPPMGLGKFIDGKIQFKEIDIRPEWLK
jgi:hypothetical protein